MEAYLDKPKNLSFHWINLILFHAAMLAVTVLQNFIAFLFAWEIMAVSAFFMVIFEGHKQKTIKAGINYLIQSHVAIILLSLGFIWISSVTSSFDFKSISEFVATKSPQTSLVLMLIFFIGFGIKAGFVPFHTWLPHAHPVAPSHVSGIMSGVLIKIGIYGILRMVFLFNTNYLVFGYLMLGISILTGVYGVMLAIVQHDLKRLLAYHSIENIGIIGIGIGLGCIGLGTGNVLLARLGFAGALLHTLNHSLFKSLLFYSAGNVYQSIHSMHIDGLGGLIKKMPHTAFLFLIAALAICGLPPFNGFISEFIIYTGLFNGILSSGFPQILAFVASIFSLSIIGGLAILCFTKAFGIVFLGTPRQHLDFHPVEKNWRRIFPMYLIVILIVAIGTFPQAFEGLLSMPVNLLSLKIPNASTGISLNLEMAASIGFYSLGFIILAGLVYFIRTRLSKNQSIIDSTWGCGYVGTTDKMQYTASSFVRTYRKLAEPLIHFNKHQISVEGVFPGKAAHQTHAIDKCEIYLIDKPIRNLRHFLNRFSFLQNGRLQIYILYGMIYIALLIAIPAVIYLIGLIGHFINTL